MGTRPRISIRLLQAGRQACIARALRLGDEENVPDRSRWPLYYIPEIPFSWIDTPPESELRAKLRDLCSGTNTGCDAIAISHNPNLSNRRQFEMWYRDVPLEKQREETRIEVNPFKLGMTDSTDTHRGTPGPVSEADYIGKYAHKRREAFATSGT